mmetsp:Transcript_109651/g.189718  ORF Transcript_109651/g.189718 Transcript_109651/m.189718 type:complete len:247 (-) Transcript_109651:714-1454(-)
MVRTVARRTSVVNPVMHSRHGPRYRRYHHLVLAPAPVGQRQVPLRPRFETCAMAQPSCTMRWLAALRHGLRQCCTPLAQEEPPAVRRCNPQGALPQVAVASAAVASRRSLRDLRPLSHHRQHPAVAPTVLQWGLLQRSAPLPMSLSSFRRWLRALVEVVCDRCHRPVRAYVPALRPERHGRVRPLVQPQGRKQQHARQQRLKGVARRRNAHAWPEQQLQRERRSSAERERLKKKREESGWRSDKRK